MENIFEIVLTTGLIGIFISTIVNLYISFRNLKAQKDLETHKVSLSFIEEKLKLLRDLRSKVTGLTDMKPVYQALTGKNSKKGYEYLGYERTKYLQNADSYKEIRFCFPSDIREKIDKRIEQFNSLDDKVGIYLLNSLNKKTMKGKIPKDIHASLKLEFEQMWTYGRELIKAIDEH